MVYDRISIYQEVRVQVTYIQAGTIYQWNEGCQHLVDSSRMEEPAAVICQVAHIPARLAAIFTSVNESYLKHEVAAPNLKLPPRQKQVLA